MGVGFKGQSHPAFVENRLKLFNEIKKKVDEAYQGAEKADITITVRL